MDIGARDSRFPFGLLDESSGASSLPIPVQPELTPGFYNFGAQSSPSQIIADWASLWTLSATPPVRGDFFIAPNELRVSTSERVGWTLMQAPSNALPFVIGTALIPVSAPAALFPTQEFTLDGSNTAVVSAPFFLWIYGASLAGTFDPDNSAFLTVARTAPDEWTIIFSVVDATVQTVVDTIILTNTPFCPVRAIGIERSGTSYRGWIHDGYAFRPMGAAFAATFTADRLAMILQSGDADSPILGLRQVGIYPTQTV
jgi:hypothetical protein